MLLAMAEPLKPTMLTRILLLILLSPLSLIAQEKDASLVLISLDGFRHDYLEKYQPPHLLKLRAEGSSTQAMRPSYPSKTFPNHLSIVTGLTPGHHGIIHNEFYDTEREAEYAMGKGSEDASWLKGIPLWNLAKLHGLKSATYFWPESEARYGGMQPDFYMPFSQNSPYEGRVEQILEWLSYPKHARPQFVAGYFSLVDSIGHDFGPDAPQTRDAVLYVDSLIGKLVDGIDKLDYQVNLVVVSDHGMINIERDKAIFWEKLDAFEHMHMVNGYTQLMLYNDKQKPLHKIKQTLLSQSSGRYTLLERTEIEKKYDNSSLTSLPDLMLEAIPPYSFINEDDKDERFGAGTHGFDPLLYPEMGALFIARGPAFKKGLMVPQFQNIHLYPMMAEVMGITPITEIDGKTAVLGDILK